MCTIVTTVGGASANSYASIAQATAYNAAHIHGASWAAAVELDQCKALQTATRTLDAMMDWYGEVVSDTQALLWPRYHAYGGNGLTVPSTIYPPELVNATAELARLLLASDLSADLPADAQGVSAMTVGPLSFTFREGAQAQQLPSIVYFMIQHLGSLRQRGAGSVSLERC